MVDLKDVKSRVSRDWKIALPALNAYSPTTFFKVAGPFILGLKLIGLGGSRYRPHFVMYPLYKNSAKECLDAPVVLMQLLNSKQLQFNIDYSRHDAVFPDAVTNLKKQFPILFGETTLKQLDAVFNEAAKDILVKTNSANQAKLLEASLFSHLFCGSGKLEEMLALIGTKGDELDSKQFEFRFGNFYDWVNKLKNTIDDRQQFIERVMKNLSDKKLSRLTRSQLLA